MKKTVTLTDTLSVEFIDDAITQVEKVAGNALYTTIYTADSFVKIAGDVPCQAGWSFRAAIIHHKYHKEPILFWYEVQDQARVFPGRAKYASHEEFLDYYYGEVFHCDVHRGLFSSKPPFSLKKKWSDMYDMLVKLSDMK